MFDFMTPLKETVETGAQWGFSVVLVIGGFMGAIMLIRHLFTREA